MSKKLIYLVSFVLVLGLVSSTSAELVGQWKLDDGAGTTAMDATGNGNDGTLEDGPTVVDGQFGQALAFESSRVVIPASDSLTPDLFQGSFTLSAWINPKRTGNTWQQIFRAVAASYNNDTLFLNNDGRLSWRGTVGGAWAGGMCETAPDVVPADQWTHVAVTGDGTNFRIYVDGALSQESAFQTTDGANETYYIGGAAGGESYSGMVDDLRVYNHVLSEDDVRASMENQGGAIVKAYGPDPRDGAMLEATWVTLTWRAGDFAVSHDVYMGDNFDDVNNGATDTFQGNLADTMLITGFVGFPFPDGLVPGTTYYWRIDEVNDTDPNSPWKGDVWSFWIPPRKAYEPNPADSVRFVPPDADLNWTAGFGAKLHTVYLGDNFDDVNNAVVGLPQADTTYTPGTLELEKFYYWRIDEFDGLATHKGDVWSFRTLPDWSGHDNHGTFEGEPQWVPGYDGGALEFDGDDWVDCGDVLTITDAITIACWVNPAGLSGDKGWVTRQAAYAFKSSGTSLRFTTPGLVDYTADNTVLETGTWQHVAVTFRPDQAGGAVFYLNGIEAQRMDSTAMNPGTGPFRIGNNQWSQYYEGMIDDVRIYNKVLTQEEIAVAMRGDPLLAGNPKPANWSTPYIRDATPLSWSPGDNASQHDVYFGTDRGAVADADASDTTGIYRGRQSITIYTPPDVEWGGGPYYWRIDEYNTDATISKGNVWSFTVTDFIGIDDIEDYNDYPPDEIFSTWIDGWEVPTNGSLAGHPDPPFAETGNVHGGRQSMPVYYENNFKYSEITMTPVSVRDWTEEGVGVLSLWFYGDAANDAESMYVNLNDIATVYHDNPDAALINTWTEWTIDLQEFATQGVNLTNVNTLSIGFGDKNNLQAGGSGMVLFDDIRLYRPPTPEPEPAP